jgi:hypothetical protein
LYCRCHLPADGGGRERCWQCNKKKVGLGRKSELYITIEATAKDYDN